VRNGNITGHGQRTYAGPPLALHAFGVLNAGWRLTVRSHASKLPWHSMQTYSVWEARGESADLAKNATGAAAYKLPYGAMLRGLLFKAFLDVEGLGGNEPSAANTVERKIVDIQKRIDPNPYLDQRLGG